jgi:hypothetical protein
VNGIRSQPHVAETLEVRQMPATLVNPMTLIYQDIDGDSFATLGEINGGILNLGAVSIDGDLGHIDAGGVKGLTAQSIGRFGLNTGASTLVSQISGKLDSLTVKGDVVEADLEVTTEIGPVSIGGSLIGGAGMKSGRINSAGPIGTVVINGDLVDGNGNQSGEVESLGNISMIGAVTVGGDWIASSVSAGVNAGADGKFGTADDTKTQATTTAIDDFFIGITADLKLREVL